MEEENDWEPDGCLATPYGAISDSEEDFFFYNKKGLKIFSFDEKEEVDNTTIYKGVKIQNPVLVTRVNTKVMHGFNVFINFEQKFLDSFFNVERVIVTDECVIFDITKEDSDWEVNIDAFHRLW